MTNSHRVHAVASACLVISLASCVLLLRHLDKVRPKATIEDTLYISSPKVVHDASLGFDGLMACLYWTRTVQYFGHRHFDGAESYNELAPLLEITTALDPHMTPAYQFGASFLAPRPPGGAGQPERAVHLMEYGIAHNPDNWQLYYDLAFVYYTELKNYQKASEVFERGSKVPNAHPFMKIMAAQTAQHAGDYATARMLWTATYESSRETNIRQNAVEHLRAIRVDADVIALQAAATRFGERTGRLPVSLAEVASAEHWTRVPVDPDGHSYKLSPDGRVLVESPDDFPFITKGTPPGYKAPPPKFHPLN
jgi:hypothetical protein